MLVMIGKVIFYHKIIYYLQVFFFPAQYLMVCLTSVLFTLVLHLKGLPNSTMEVQTLQLTGQVDCTMPKNLKLQDFVMSMTL